MKTKKVASHTIYLPNSSVKYDVRHEHLRLYKFIDWFKIKGSISQYILDTLLQNQFQDMEQEDLTVVLDSVNPMRRSRFGGFYFDIKGRVVDTNGDDVAFLEEFGIGHEKTHNFTCHDVKENIDREEVERQFGGDQFPKEESIRRQALQKILLERGGKIVLDSPESVMDLVAAVMKETGWDIKKDNRLQSRISRLDPTVVVPD